jgi:glycoprotease/Kae1 family metallohydrolase
MVIVLGIESTAHTFGVGIVRDGKVLANVRDMYTTETGGIIPMDSAKHHEKVAEEVYRKALRAACIAEFTPKGVPRNFSAPKGVPSKEGKEKFTEGIDAIAFSQSPGLAPCLIQGMKFAKYLSENLEIPLVGVNHCVAHLEVGAVTAPTGCTPKHSSKECLQGAEAFDPVMLYASGANTQVIAYEAGKYRVFGETLDVGVGNFIDNFARYAGIGFPGGPKIEKLALAGNKENLIELPYKVKGMDVALSGILTNLRQKLGKHPIEDLSYSLQETVFAMLVETAERALAHTGKKELLLGGGVACNERLQEMCKIMCKERGAKFFCPERPLLVDNGAMIAYLGEIMFRKKANVFSHNELDKFDINPRERTDDVDVNWK